MGELDCASRKDILSIKIEEEADEEVWPTGKAWLVDQPVQVWVG